nr:MAG TPA: hypothetical protein [Caudoviricetes sp.]
MKDPHLPLRQVGAFLVPIMYPCAQRIGTRSTIDRNVWRWGESKKRPLADPHDPARKSCFGDLLPFCP